MPPPQTRSTSTIEPARLVSDEATLTDMLADIARAGALAVDCEQNGLHAYRARVCLVQVSTGRADWIIDPLAGIDMKRLATTFSDPAITKVFHAAEEDVIGLARDYDLAVAGLFDTMWGAKMLGWPRVGLAPILEERFGVVLDKHMQRHDWGQRPLDGRALAYAQLDTHYLLDLWREEEAELRKAGRLDDAREIFEELAESRAIPPASDPGAYRLKGERELSGRSRAVAHALADGRDEQAQRRDRPQFKIIGDRELVAIAAARPKTIEALRAVEGVASRLIDRNAGWLFDAVKRGRSAPDPPRPLRQPRDDAAAARYEAMRRWRNRVAEEHGVSGEVIVPNDALRVIARAAPSTLAELHALGVLGPRRLAAHGDGLITVLSKAKVLGVEHRAAPTSAVRRDRLDSRR